MYSYRFSVGGNTKKLNLIEPCILMVGFAIETKKLVILIVTLI